MNNIAQNSAVNLKTATIVDCLKLLGESINRQLQCPSNEFERTVELASNQNAWFTTKNIHMALSGISRMLEPAALDAWVKQYSIVEKDEIKTIGAVFAGNIPLVGFHDLVCVLVSGNRLLAKLSSKDSALYRYIKNLLADINVELAERIQFTDEALIGFDAIIATGSDNSSRYFEYYFGKYPNIIRKNRSSMAVIDGNESHEELKGLVTDINSYFGLGCRNVSLLAIPRQYQITSLLDILANETGNSKHHKYANNYDYQRTLFLMNKTPFLDTGEVLVRESNQLVSPVAVLHYFYYDNINEVEKFIKTNQKKIQCVCAKTKMRCKTYFFGQAQFPGLADYADNIDTLQFLIDLK